jgi:hypothetical protein
MKSLVFGICTVLVLSVSGKIWACSFQPGYEAAAFRIELGAATSAPPSMRLQTFERGFDDGQTDTCATFGTLSFVIDAPVRRISDAYRFKVLSGELPVEIFPNTLIAPVSLGDGQWGFAFHWQDLPPGGRILAPIDAIVTVQSVSEAGAVSASTAFRIRHPGGLAPTIDTPTTAVLDWVTVGLVVMPLIVLVVVYLKRRRQLERRLRYVADQIDERSSD